MQYMQYVLLDQCLGPSGKSVQKLKEKATQFSKVDPKGLLYLFNWLAQTLGGTAEVNIAVLASSCYLVDSNLN